MGNFVFKWKIRFNVSGWPQIYKDNFISSKAFNFIDKLFNIMIIARVIR